MPQENAGYKTKCTRFLFCRIKMYMNGLKRYVREVLKCTCYTKVLINTSSQVSPRIALGGLLHGFRH